MNDMYAVCPKCKRRYPQYLKPPEKDLFQAKFCEFCGVALIKECPKCEQPIVSESKEVVICRFCGSNLFEQK